MRILFFIGTLGAGGKERRLVELLSYLRKHTDHELLLVVRKDQMEYPAFNELNIPYLLLTTSYIKGDKSLHFNFYKICKKYKPDIVHTWGRMPAFVSILAVILLRIPHINSQITDAPPHINRWSFKNFINTINFRFSTIILANSYAGLNAYKAENSKSRVIYNGINPDRFINLPDKLVVRAKYGIATSYAVIMVASFTKNKDWNLFLDIAKRMAIQRNDVTFISVGDGYNQAQTKQRVNDEDIRNVIFTGKISNVEQLVNSCDIGILFSPFGEGISNSILEYMALAKPVIANDSGGTIELVKNGENGYLITTESAKEIAEIIEELLDDSIKRLSMGEAGRKLIHESFSIERMGKEIEDLYFELAQK